MVRLLMFLSKLALGHSSQILNSFFYFYIISDYSPISYRILCCRLGKACECVVFYVVLIDIYTEHFVVTSNIKSYFWIMCVVYRRCLYKATYSIHGTAHLSLASSDVIWCFFESQFLFNIVFSLNVMAQNYLMSFCFNIFSKETKNSLIFLLKYNIFFRKN